VSSATRAIVIAPHPDDGVLGAGGLIERIVSRHGSVDIVEMTSGDAFPKGVAAVRRATPLTPDSFRWYGTLREREALLAMRRLGVARSRVRLLGFPDEGLCELANDRSTDAVFSSAYTHRDSPPTPEQVVAGAKYRGADLRRELEELLVAFRPNLVVMPDPHDEHPDHCATHLLVHAAVDAAVRRGLHQPRMLHYLIHYRDWPAGPAAFAATEFTTLHLSESERSAKRQAMAAYRSQMTVMADFIAAFDRPDERFTSGDHEAPAPCWCRGENIVPRAITGR
jgi:LmbE family N-acetylglucosaminyl deacetylase